MEQLRMHPETAYRRSWACKFDNYSSFHSKMHIFTCCHIGRLSIKCKPHYSTVAKLKLIERQKLKNVNINIKINNSDIDLLSRYLIFPILLTNLHLLFWLERSSLDFRTLLPLWCLRLWVSCTGSFFLDPLALSRFLHFYTASCLIFTGKV